MNLSATRPLRLYASVSAFSAVIASESSTRVRMTVLAAPGLTIYRRWAAVWPIAAFLFRLPVFGENVLTECLNEKSAIFLPEDKITILSVVRLIAS